MANNNVVEIIKNCNKPLEKPAATAGTAAGTAEGTAGVPLKEDPRYMKYFKMIAMNIPKQATKLKMQSDGLDPAILDMDPNSPASAIGSAAPAAPAGPPKGLLAGIQGAPKLKKAAPPPDDEPAQKSTGNPMLVGPFLVAQAATSLFI